MRKMIDYSQFKKKKTRGSGIESKGNLGKERHGGFFIINGTSNGDELAFLNVFLEGNPLFDCGECTRIIAAAASHSGFVLGLGDGEERSVDTVLLMITGYRYCHRHLSFLVHNPSFPNKIK